MPHQPVLITHPGGPYYYSSGVWYRPYGSSYVVVGAPLGVYVPILPVYYTTLWVSGVPYYYANDTYYTWNPAQNGYEVVAPPSDPGAVSPPPPSDDLFIYPQNGQSSEQQANDKYECHQWAVGQTGFDPTQARRRRRRSVGQRTRQLSARHARLSRGPRLQRALTACAVRESVRPAAGFCRTISTCPTLMRPSGRPIQRAIRFCTRAGSA